MGNFSSDPTVFMINNRLKQLGIDLAKYLGTITNTWPSTPPGFGFICADQLGDKTLPPEKQQAYMKLMDAIVQNQNFGSDNMLAGSQHRGASFRECGKPDSLHVILSKTPDPQSKNTCSVHLDSVSFAVSVDPKTRMVQYDYGKALQHIATDLLHTPLIVPSSEKGLVFGFRF